MGAVSIGVHAKRDTTRWFYAWMAGACAFIAFAGFAPTYWLQLPPGTFVVTHEQLDLWSAWFEPPSADELA